MKKILLSLTLAVLAASMNAETLADFSQQIGTFTNYGTTTTASVKIHNNKDSKPGIKLANSYFAEGKLTANYASVACDGGFKAGDVVTVAGAFNNDDDTKNSKVDFFKKNGEEVSVIFTTQQFINGRTSADEPVEETFTLTEDMDTLYFGRNGNTGTIITTLKVVRGEESPETPVEKPKSDALAEYNGIIFNGGVLAGTFTAGGSCLMDEPVKIHENKDEVKGMKFASSYKKDGALTENYVSVTCEGGFLQGDIVKIAGCYNNADEKETRIVVFALDDDKNIMVLHETELMINGRTSADEPAVEQFELDGDYETLYLGRQGATGTFVTTFIVDRPDEEIETWPGDVNEDKKTDISDIVAIINQIAGTSTYARADVNNDNKVDISDIVAVINIIAAGE